MSAFVGANPEELRELADLFANMAGTLEQIRSQIGRSLNTAEWYGDEADSFRSSWLARHAATVEEVSRALSGAATRLRFECSQQLSASGGSGAGDTPGLTELLLGELLGIGGDGLVLQGIERGGVRAAEEEDLQVELGGVSSIADLIQGLAAVPQLANIDPLVDTAEALSGLGPALPIMGMVSDLPTLVHPDFAGTAGDLERGVARINLLATAGEIAIDLTGAADVGGVFAADAAAAPIPGVDVAVAVASGLYLTGSVLYAHDPAFRAAVDGVGRSIDEVGSTIADDAVLARREDIQLGARGVDALGEAVAPIAAAEQTAASALTEEAGTGQTVASSLASALHL